jgi:hypothetical protein
MGMNEHECLLLFWEFRSSGVTGVTDDTFSVRILKMELIKLTSATPVTPELLNSPK